MSLDPEENANKYLFKCEKCNCIFSDTWCCDIWKYGKDTKSIYVTVEDVGEAQTTEIYKEKEFKLEEINALANDL